MKTIEVCPSTLRPGFSAYSPQAIKELFDGVGSGQPVYITKRFDVVNGVKESSQEDFATVLQMTEEGSDLGLMDGLSPKT